MSDATKDTLMEMCHQQVTSISKMMEGSNDFILDDGGDKDDGGGGGGGDYEMCGFRT